MQNIIQQLLKEFDENELESVSGDLIYSDPKLTLKKGKYYFLGFNPGGDETENEEYTLRRAIEDMLSGNGHFYCQFYKDHHKFKSLQKRYQFLCHSILNIKPEHVFTTNLIFHPSRNIAGVSYQEEAKKCWKAHQVFLKIVQPEVIFCNGNGTVSSFAFVQQFIQNKTRIEEFDSGHGSWKIRILSGDLFGHTIKIIGIPHMSYYAPNKGLKILSKLCF